MIEWPSDSPAWLIEAFEDMDNISRKNLANPASGVSSERGAGYIQCLEHLREHVEQAKYEEEQKRTKAMEAFEKARANQVAAS